MIEVGSFGWVLRGTGDTIAATFYADGVAVDPGTVTVDIARADGTPPRAWSRSPPPRRPPSTS